MAGVKTAIVHNSPSLRPLPGPGGTCQSGRDSRGLGSSLWSPTFGTERSEVRRSGVGKPAGCREPRGPQGSESARYRPGGSRVVTVGTAGTGGLRSWTCAAGWTAVTGWWSRGAPAVPGTLRPEPLGAQRARSHPQTREARVGRGTLEEARGRVGKAEVAWEGRVSQVRTRTLPVALQQNPSSFHRSCVLQPLPGICWGERVWIWNARDRLLPASSSLGVLGRGHGWAT